jgi:hypothetical protein
MQVSGLVRCRRTRLAWIDWPVWFLLLARLDSAASDVKHDDGSYTAEQQSDST